MKTRRRAHESRDATLETPRGKVRSKSARMIKSRQVPSFEISDRTPPKAVRSHVLEGTRVP